MKFKLEKLSVLLMDPLLSDQQLTESFIFLRDFPIQSVFVLPVNVARAKHLLRDTLIKVGTFIDYPLANGTIAKKIFETVNASKQGATIILIPLTFPQLVTFTESEFFMLKKLSLGDSKIGFFLDISQLSKIQKKEVFFQLYLNKLDHISFNLAIEHAFTDVSSVSVGKQKQDCIQVNLQEPTLLEIEMILRAGATVVAIENFQEILSLLS